MKKNTISLAVFSLFVFFISGIASAWDIKSHQEISGQAINISQLAQYLENELGLSFSSKRFSGPGHSENKITTEEFGPEKSYTVSEWLLHGSEAEDELLKWFKMLYYIQRKDLRADNHYYNPFWDNSIIYPYPYPDFAEPGSDEDWSFQQGGLYDLFGSTATGWDLWAGKPSTRWGYNGCKDANGNIESPPYSDFTRSDDNYFSWVYARKYFYAALSGDSTELDGVGGIVGEINMDENERNRCFALLFRSIGQLMHLVQDTANPEHTRNDAHPTSGTLWFGFEYYGDQQNLSNPSWSSPVIPWKLIVKSDNPFFDFIDSNRSGGGYSSSASTGMAEFSNYNFFSLDSIADNIMYDYCEPDCEPHGHERHRFFTHPRINETRFALEQGFIHNTYYYLSEPITDPLGIYPSTSVKLAKRKWYTGKLLMYGWRDYTTADKKIHNDYFSVLIPKSIGYSSALLDYFFRGKLEISAPDEFVYSIIDGSTSPHLFTHLKAKLKNATPNEEMLDGTILAVAKYKKRTDYQPDLSTDPPAAASRETDFSYSVSAPIGITTLSPVAAEEFLFDFSANPIPAGITDLYLQVIFRGTLGKESDAIAVGLKDLNEPQHLVFWNNTDYFLLNGESRKAEDIENDPDVANYGYIYPYEFTEEIGFSSTDPDGNTPMVALLDNLPPARYSRLIILVDNPTSYWVKDHITSTPYQQFPDVVLDDTIWEYTFPGVVNQEAPDGSWNNTAVYDIRRIVQHQMTYFLRDYPYFLYDPYAFPAPLENSLGPYPVTTINFP